jgi:hypothetical protein
MHIPILITHNLQKIFLLENNLYIQIMRKVLHLENPQFTKTWW